MPVALVGVAIAAAGAAASAAAKKKAAKKAASAQKKGIQQQENLLRKKLDPAALNRLAQEVDRERALGRLKLQGEVDPQIAELRKFSEQRILDLSKQEQASKQSQQVVDALVEENITPDANMERLKDTIIQRAQQDFDAGASLPPEFQAELVRSGLSTSGGAGIGVSRDSAGGVTSRLLGGAGIQLQQQRAAEGAALAGAADSLARSRQQILSSIFPTVKAQEESEYNRAIQGLQLSEATLPESGITGAEAVNIEGARQKGLAGLIGQRAGVNAQMAQARGDFNAAMIGAAASAAGGVAGGIGGLGGAGALGSGINYGSLAQSIMGQGGQPGFTNNPFFGAAPGAIPYQYAGDPTLLSTTRRI